MMYSFSIPKPNKIQRLKLLSETFHPEFEERGIVLAEILYIPLLGKEAIELLNKRFSKNSIYKKLLENIEYFYWSIISTDLLSVYQKLLSLPLEEQKAFLIKEIESIREGSNKQYDIIKLTESNNRNNINIVSLFEEVISNALLYNTNEIQEILYEFNNGKNDFKYRENYKMLLEAVMNISLYRFLQILQVKLTEIDTGIIVDYDTKTSESLNKNYIANDILNYTNEEKENGKNYSKEIPLQNKDKKVNKETNTDSEIYLRSINEISSFIGCSNTTAQKIKNNYPAIFIQIGRKFIVKKEDLLKAINNKKK